MSCVQKSKSKVDIVDSSLVLFLCVAVMYPDCSITYHNGKLRQFKPFTAIISHYKSFRHIQHITLLHHFMHSTWSIYLLRNSFWKKGKQELEGQKVLLKNTSIAENISHRRCHAHCPWKSSISFDSKNYKLAERLDVE